MGSRKQPAPPAGTKTLGRALWRSVLDEYDLDEHELTLLRQATATVDVITLLQCDIDGRGPIVPTPQGEKVNPAIVEVRQQRLALARLLAALRLPAGDEADRKPGARLQRPQRRGGVRGPQRLGVVL